jgi:hypothetical protein
MNDYDKQKWFDLYKTALLELNRAAMTGRISDARGEIATRLERLKQHPALHQHLQESVQKLASVAPKFAGPSQQENSN